MQTSPLPLGTGVDMHSAYLGNNAEPHASENKPTLVPRGAVDKAHR